MKTYLVLLIAACIVFSSCNLFSNYGKKVEIGESEIYYKGDDVTEQEASALGKFLVKNKVITKNKQSSVQLSKEDGIYIVKLVVSKTAATEDIRLNLWRTQLSMSKEVFDGTDTRFAFTDDKFNTWESLAPVAVTEVGGGQIYYDNSEFKKAQVKKLSDFLLEKKYLGEDTKADVFLTKDDETPIVRFIYDEKVGKQENIVLAFSYWQHLLQQDVFNDKKTKIILTTTEYVDFKKIPKITSQQLEQLEQPVDNNTNTLQDSISIQNTVSGVERIQD